MAVVRLRAVRADRAVGRHADAGERHPRVDSRHTADQRRQGRHRSRGAETSRCTAQATCSAWTRGQIVRRYPAPGATNAEETFHAHIEFDRPEVPWAFSAHTPGNQMPRVARARRVRARRGRVGAGAGRAAADRGGGCRAAAAAGHRVGLGTCAGQRRNFIVERSAVHGVRAGQRVAAAGRAHPDAEHQLRRVPGPDDRRRAQGRARPDRRHARPRLDASRTARSVCRSTTAGSSAPRPDGDFARLARRLEGVAAPWEIGRRTMDTSRPGDPLDDLGPATAAVGR